MCLPLQPVGKGILGERELEDLINQVTAQCRSPSGDTHRQEVPSESRPTTHPPAGGCSISGKQQNKGCGLQIPMTSPDCLTTRIVQERGLKGYIISPRQRGSSAVMTHYPNQLHLSNFTAMNERGTRQWGVVSNEAVSQI